MTKEQALAFYSSGWWNGKSSRAICLFQMFEDRLCMQFPLFHKAIEEALNRPVYTHEFGLNREGLQKELLGKAPPPTLQDILDLIPEAKRIILI